MQPSDIIRFSAAKGILWRELALTLSLPTGLTLAAAFVGMESDEIAWLWVVLMWLVLWLSLSAFGSLPWWFRYRTVEVRATPDSLVVVAGTRTLLDVPVSSIHQIRVYGYANWSTLLMPYNVVPGPFPKLVVWGDSRWESPPLMLWGDQGERMERELQQVLRQRF